MSLWAIVPVKPLRRRKSRLSKILTGEERYELNAVMLNNVLSTLSSVDEIDQLLVLSRDAGTLSVARAHGARTLQEEKKRDLNLAIRKGVLVAKTFGAGRVLVVSADLPLLQPDDIRTFIRQSQGPPELIIAPDRHEKGTNAIFVNPLDLIDNYMGKGSFSHHIEYGKKNGFDVKVCRLDTFELDIDNSDDLELWKTHQSKQDGSEIILNEGD